MDGAGVSKIYNRYRQEHGAWPHDDATYLHWGRAAAMCLAPLDPNPLQLTSKLVIALMAENVSGVELRDILVLTGTWGERQRA